MKRLIVAVILLFFSAGASFVTGFVAENAIEKTKDALMMCVQDTYGEKQAHEKIEQALDAWHRNKKFLFAITVHDDFSEIEKNMTELSYYAKRPDCEKISKISYETWLLLDDLREDFSISAENIF